jgi:DNA sulfur modification protein DndC
VTRAGAFDELGYSQTIAEIVREASDLYLADKIPWVVGYSGGKDSTAVLQIVWSILEGLTPLERHKPVYVISTDTLVENPVVARWVALSLEKMGHAAATQGLPIEPHRLTPAVENTFWVSLIGKGYPAPRPKFRWCTERLKIKPSNSFIRKVVRDNGEAILVLGTRKAESSGRRHRMEQLEGSRVRERLSPNDSLPNSLVYSPIEDWTNDDVWLYLMQSLNPWGYDNKDLLSMYAGASADNECPLVVDTSTPSCGDSRFGCWTCTLVDKDRSMSAMIQNDEEKEWMLPLLELRDALDVTDDRPLRDFRRMNGAVQLFHDRPIPGPYTEAARHNWLRRLLEAQVWIRSNGPEYVREIDLITLPELHEIRRIWVFEKHEIEDALPTIYRDVVGTDFPGPSFEDQLVLRSEDLTLLRDLCVDDDLHYQLTRELLDVERQFRTMTRRAGLFDALESGFRRAYFDDEEDAVSFARRRSGAENFVEDVDGAEDFVDDSEPGSPVEA